MGSKTDYLENKLIDFRFRGQPYTPPSTIYIGLFTTAPTDTGGGVEVSGGAYSRVAVPATLAEWAGTQGLGTTTISTGTSGTTSNNSPICSNGANWGIIVAMGIFEAATGNSLTDYAALTTPKTKND